MGAAPLRRPLVGRASEQDELESGFRRSRAGALQCVLIEGDAGMGKTRLVTEFLSARRRGSLVLAGRGYPFGSSAAFGLWAEALESHLRRLPPEEVRALCGGSAADLEGMLRSVALATPPGSGEAGAARRPLEALAVLLENMSLRQPLIVHLDDMHLADASSWEALDYLAHNLAQAPILILVCARAGELGQWAPKETLFRLEQEAMLSRIHLRPLSLDDIRRLAEAVLDRPALPVALIEWLAERSRGTPLFVLGLLDALVEQDVDLSAPRLPAIPAALTERVLASVARLERDERTILELLAVVGHEADLHELIRCGGGPQEQAEAALVALLDARFIEAGEGAAGARYRIVHPLVQEAIYESMVIPRRRALHRAVGRSLLADGRLGEAAPHLVRSAQTGDPEAIEGLARAARQAWATRAYAEAFEILSALLEVIPAGDAQSLEVLNLIGLEGEWFFHHKTDVDYALCIRVLRKAERLLRSTDNQRRVAALNAQLASFLAWGSGDLSEAERRGRAALEAFRALGDERHAVLALNELTQIVGITGGFAAQEEAAGELVRAAEASGDPGAVLLALANVASTVWPRGRFGQAEQLYRRCIELASEDRNTLRLRHGHIFLAMTLALEGRLDEALRTFAAAEATDPDFSDGLILEFRPHIAWFTGNMPATLASARSSIARVGPRRLTAVLMLGALAASETGETSVARMLLTEAGEMLTQRRRWMIRPYYRWAAGVFAGRSGETRRALDELERSATHLLEIEALPIAGVVLSDLVDVAAPFDAEVADRAAGALRAVAQRLATDLYRGLSALAGAEIDCARGRSGRAVEQATEAVDLLGGRGYALFEARALDVAGRSLAASDRVRAVENAERAATMFQACGAAWRRDRALESLRALGKPGRRAAAGLGRSALSRREREVVDLAIHGLTAREIGSRLFIGERTVETHLSNAYAKLGVRSRVELLRRAPERPSP